LAFGLWRTKPTTLIELQGYDGTLSKNLDLQHH
jgi:hypothetical protein